MTSSGEVRVKKVNESINFIVNLIKSKAIGCNVVFLFGNLTSVAQGLLQCLDIRTHASPQLKKLLFSIATKSRPSLNTGPLEIPTFKPTMLPLDRCHPKQK